MSDLTPCVVDDDDVFCRSYRPGHHTHFIHAKHVGRTPWGWRDAVVGGLDGHWTTVTYVDSGRQLRLWHHTELAGELEVGAPVRVHEQYSVLGAPLGWLNVVVQGGLGAVPKPADTETWRSRMTGGVQDLSTGRGLAVDWRSPQGS